MNKRTKFLIASAAVFLSISLVFAADKAAPKYPPYPDIWGYDLYDEAAVESVSNQLYPYIRKNGDIAFTYSSEFHEDNLESYYKRTLLSFFSQTKDLIPSQIKEGVAKKYNLTNFDLLRNYVVYENENSVIETSCGVNYSIYTKDRIKYCILQKGMAKPNTSGAVIDTSKPIEKYSILGVGIDKDDTPFLYISVYIIIPLEDETFIGFNSVGETIVRFDKNLKTKFKSERKIKLKSGKELVGSFHMLPYERTEYFYNHVVKNYEGKFNQDINDQFLEFLYTEQQKNKLNQ